MANPIKVYIYTTIRNFLDSNNINYTATKGFYDTKTQGSIMDNSVLNQFMLYTPTVARYTPEGRGEVIKLSKEDFKTGFSEWKSEQFTAEVTKLRSALAYCPDILKEGRDALKNWLKSVLWRDATDEEAAVMLHFLHQVKRKLSGFSVSYHIMPVLVAGQGSGKTESLKWLMRPFENMFKDSNLEALEDSRNDMQYQRCFVMMLDELSKADKADIRALKQRITSSEIQTRIFHSQDFTNVKMNTTFIGASNEPIDALIQDSTGMRRYYQLVGPLSATINAMTKADKEKYWSLKGQLIPNVFQIWQSIDESLSLLPEFEANLDSITKTQESLKAVDIIEEFLEELKIKPVTWLQDDTALYKKPIELYKAFYDFCTEAGERFPMQRNAFSAKLRAKGFVFANKKIKGESTRVVYYEKITAEDKSGFRAITLNSSVEELKNAQRIK
jgi:hypothetical protein